MGKNISPLLRLAGGTLHTYRGFQVIQVANDISPIRKKKNSSRIPLGLLVMLVPEPPLLTKRKDRKNHFSSPAAARLWYNLKFLRV